MTNVGSATFSNTVNTKFIGVAYGGSSYLKLPVIFYNVRATLGAPAGTNNLASVTIPAGFVGTTGDSFDIRVFGNSNGATTTRTITISVNGASESYNLVQGSGYMWKFELKAQRSSSTSVDMIGMGSHETSMLMIGNVGKSCTSFANAGSIVISSTVTGASDLTVRSIDIKFNPGT